MCMCRFDCVCATLIILRCPDPKDPKADACPCMCHFHHICDGLIILRPTNPKDTKAGACPRMRCFDHICTAFTVLCCPDSNRVGWGGVVL